MTTTALPYRPVPDGQGLCPVCDTFQPKTDRSGLPSFVNRHGVRQRPWVLVKHGPRRNRCAGSHTAAVPWVKAANLPTWDEMSDLDKGAALLHVWKWHWEKSAAYATANYPASYFDHPTLVGLDPRTASQHAAAVAGHWMEACDRLGVDEAWRLHDLALDADRARIAADR